MHPLNNLGKDPSLSLAIMFRFRKRFLLGVFTAVAVISVILHLSNIWTNDTNSLNDAADGIKNVHTRAKFFLSSNAGVIAIENVHAMANFLQSSGDAKVKASISPLFEFLLKCQQRKPFMKLHLLQESIIHRLQSGDHLLMQEDLLLGGAASRWTILQEDLEAFVDVVLESPDLLSKMTVGHLDDMKRPKGNY